MGSNGKNEVLQYIITGLTKKVRKGSIEHGEDGDHIHNLSELESELYDALFYVVNCKRVLRMALTHLEAGDLHKARLLISEQLQEPV